MSADFNQIALKEIISYLPHYIFWKDRDFVYCGCNNNFARMAGYSSTEQIIGKTDFDLPWAQDSAHVHREEDISILATGEPIYGKEVPIVTAMGECLFIAVSKVPLFNIKKNIIGILGIYNDVTQRKDMEYELRQAKQKAESANAAKSVFLANMSHDLRTPLNSMLGFMHVLKDKLGEEHYDNLFTDIFRAGESLTQIIDGILDFTKIESTPTASEQRKVNLHELITTVLSSNEYNAKQKPIKLSVRYPAKLPTFVITDPRYLTRILNNLISNAIKFTEQGKVTVSVKQLESNNRKAQLQIAVSDTGIGIPEHVLGEIFERFTRLDEAYRGKYTGSGLGLAIVRDLVHRLGGEISVESEPNKGSTFYCRIPFEIPVQNKLVHAAISKAKSSSMTNEEIVEKIKQAQPYVLVVEDDRLSQRAAQLVLEEIGCQVHVVGRGSEALSVQDQPFDFILLDIGLPDIDGLQVLQKIRSGYGCNTDRPVVALTAHVDDAEINSFMAKGMTAVMKKPMNKDKLVRTIYQYVLSRVSV